MESQKREGKKLPQIIAALAACIGAFGLGTTLGWTSPSIPQLEEDSNFGNCLKNPAVSSIFSSSTLDPCDDDKSACDWAAAGWIGSMVPLGGLVSGLCAGFCVEKFGRKTTMLVLSAPFVLGWLLITYSKDVPMMYAGRFISGFCGGAFSLAAPVYIGETAENSVRGMLGAGFQLMVTIGILFTYALYLVSWEWISLICGFSPLIFLVLMIFPPESPRWLISKGKHTEASEALRWLRGASSSQEVEDELAEVQKSVDEGKLMSAGFKDLLAPPIFKPTMICMGLMLFQQLSGVNAVIFYTNTIFKSAGSDIEPGIASIIVGVVQVIATVVASFLMDRAGRKILLLISDVVMCIFLVCLGVFFYFKKDACSNPDHSDIADSIGWLPLISLMAFIVAFSLGYGPIPWLIMGELLPPHVKGLAASLCTAFNWTLAFLVTKFFEDVQKALGADWTYWLFAAVCAVGTVFVFFFVPETKGKSLDEIQKYFGADVNNSQPSTSSSSDQRKRSDP